MQESSLSKKVEEIESEREQDWLKEQEAFVKEAKQKEILLFHQYGVIMN